MDPQSSLLKVRTVDQQHEHHPGACEKCRISGSTPDLFNQNLYFNSIPRCSVCISEMEKQWCGTPVLAQAASLVYLNRLAREHTTSRSGSFLPKAPPKSLMQPQGTRVQLEPTFSQETIGPNLWSPPPIQLVVVQSLSHGQLLVTPWTAALQATLFSTISQSLLKFMSIESMMLSNHFILHHPLLLLPSIFPSIRVFSNELALHIRWPSIGASALASVLPRWFRQ